MRLTKKWWFVIVVTPVVLLCIKAGLWQLDRAAEKEQLIQRLSVGEALLTTPSDLTTASIEASTYKVKLPVRLVDSNFVYLENRIQDRVAGYEVFAKALTAQGEVGLFINLGWVEGAASRDSLPSLDLSRDFDLDALWVPITDSYFMSDAFPEQMDNSTRVQSLKGVIPDDVLPGMFIASNVLSRNALGPKPRLGPETHYGYAVQWFLLALVLSFLGVYVYRRGLTHG
jgi:cytochrome oxidase assembly protein ShyY1